MWWPGAGEAGGVAAASRGVSFWGDEVLWNWTVVKVGNCVNILKNQ